MQPIFKWEEFWRINDILCLRIKFEFECAKKVLGGKETNLRVNERQMLEMGQALIGDCKDKDKWRSADFENDPRSFHLEI